MEKSTDSSELMHWKQEGKVENVCTAVKKWEKEWYENGLEHGHAVRGKGRPRKWDCRYGICDAEVWHRAEADSPDALQSVCD